MLKRALLKSQGEGTTEEILHNFLLIYRATVNSSCPNQSSPAKVTFGRKLRITLDKVIPTQPQPSRCNQQSEKWFNKHHGSKQRSDQTGQSVLARDYHQKDYPWVPGIIVARKGEVIYMVKIVDLIWKRHPNQLRPVLYNSNLSQSHDSDLQLDFLMDTFGLENPSRQCSQPQQVQQPRRSQRQPRPAKYLQVIPRSTSYW